MTPEEQAGYDKKCENLRKAREARKAKIQAAKILGSAPSNVAKAALAEVETKDELDRKLDHFIYDATDRERDVWAHSEHSVLSTPKDIKDANPGMTFHWVSKHNLDKKGKGYQGWKLYTDGNHKTGVQRADDLFLAAKPNDLAEAQRKASQDKSTEAVRDVAEGHIAMMERAVAESGGTLELMTPGEMLPHGDKRRIGSGSAVGVRGQFGKGKPFQRGRGQLSNEEVRERVIRMKEEQGKNKKYFT